MLIHSTPASGELSSYVEACFSPGVKWEDGFPRSIFGDFAEPMACRDPAKAGRGSRELTGGRDISGHHLHGAGMLPWMGQPWPGVPWVQCLLLQTLPCLSCLGPQHSGNLRQGCVWQPGLGGKAVARHSNRKLGYKSPSHSHCWPPTGRVL